MMSPESIVNIHRWTVEQREKVRQKMQTGKDADSWATVLMRMNIEIELLERIIGNKTKCITG